MCHFYLTRRASVNHAPEFFRAGGIFQPPLRSGGVAEKKARKELGVAIDNRAQRQIAASMFVMQTNFI